MTGRSRYDTSFSTVIMREYYNLHTNSE